MILSHNQSLPGHLHFLQCPDERYCAENMIELDLLPKVPVELRSKRIVLGYNSMRIPLPSRSRLSYLDPALPERPLDVCGPCRQRLTHLTKYIEPRLVRSEFSSVDFLRGTAARITSTRSKPRIPHRFRRGIMYPWILRSGELSNRFSLNDAPSCR